MSADDVLQILPHRGLDQSLLLAILLGLLVLLVFTETLGWVFVGLVVPGYLASVFIIEPSMGVTIAVEAIITYILVRLLSDNLARTTIWSPFFGRERFFLIVLVSIVVRQNSQIWLLPMVLGSIDSAFGTDLLFDANKFSSIGLVLVPLVANMFWKINLWRGLYQIGVPVLITYLILVFVLLPYTNLSFSNIEITYDNVALNFLNTPKAYVVMLVGALMAARFNLLYGWDYNGILVPSLLSLGWLEPASIVTTVAEVLILFGTTKLVLASPMLRTVNLEGPRQIALVFTLSFLLKYAMAWVVSEYVPHVNVIDMFGYGYVITSLLTVKMLQKKVVGRVLLPTLHVSLLAFVCGSLVGFGLEKLAPRSKPQAAIAVDSPAATRTILRAPLGAMAVAAVRAREVPPPELAQGRPAATLQRYARMWRLIDTWLKEPTPARTEQIALAAESLGLSMRELGRGAAPGRTSYVIMEAEERLDQQTGWDTAVLFPGAPGPVIEVPRPRNEPPSTELAAVLCERLRCRAILVSGLDSADDGSTAGDALAHDKATLRVATESLRSAPIVQLRTSDRVPEATARLHLHHKLPEQVTLDRLWPRAVGLDLELTWTPPPGPNQGWARTDRIVLFLHPDAAWRVLIDYADRAAEAPPRRRGISLKSWLRDTFASSGLGASQTVPSESEVRFIGHLLAARLLQMQPERIRWLNHLARLIDYEIAELEDCADDAACWVLTERARPVAHRWGTLAVRTGGGEPLAIEAPRPLIEGGSWQIAVEMWHHERARVLLVGHDIPAIHGASPLDPVRYANVVTPFHAMHESVHRALRRDTPEPPAPLIVQVRGFAGWRQIPEHLVIGLGPPALVERQTPARLAPILGQGGFLGWLRDDAKFARGEPAYITLAGQGNPQLSFTHNAAGVDIALAWFSYPVRELYMDESIEAATQRIESAGFVLTPRSAIDFLARGVAMQARGTPRGAARFDDLVALAERYATTQDVAIARRLRSLAGTDPRVRVSASWSTEISTPFLAIGMDGPDELRRAVILLSQFADDCTDLPNPAPNSREELRAALIRRCRTISTRVPTRGP